MIKKSDLEKLKKLKKEKEELEIRIQKLESKPRKIIVDGVKGSSATFPYTEHTCKIEGFDYSIEYRRRKNLIYKLKRILKEKQRKLEKEILHIEYELNYVEDPEIRELIRLKYEEDLNWIQIMYKMDYNSESYARMKLERFFQKK